MLQHLKPSEADIEKLALDETDLAQQARFAPFRRGFLGNLLIIIFAGSLGFIHALLTALWHRAFPPASDGTH